MVYKPRDLEFQEKNIFLPIWWCGNKWCSSVSSVSPELLWNGLHIEPNYNAWKEIAKWVLIATELFNIVVNDFTARNLSVIVVSLRACHFYKLPGMFFQKFVIIIQHVVKLQIIDMFQLYYVIPTPICYLPSKNRSWKVNAVSEPCDWKRRNIHPLWCYHCRQSSKRSARNLKARNRKAIWNR